jgi:hypothetical protein
VGLLDHMADLCLDFQEVSILFSKLVALACIATSSVQGVFFPHILPTHVVGGVFVDSYSNRGKVES